MNMAAFSNLERGLGLCLGGHCSRAIPQHLRWGFGDALPKGCITVGRKSGSAFRHYPPHQGEPPMPFYERGDVRIHYEEAGSGFPLMVIPGGGLNSTVAG